MNQTTVHLFSCQALESAKSTRSVETLHPTANDDNYVESTFCVNNLRDDSAEHTGFGTWVAPRATTFNRALEYIDSIELSGKYLARKKPG